MLRSDQESNTTYSKLLRQSRWSKVGISHLRSPAADVETRENAAPAQALVHPTRIKRTDYRNPATPLPGRLINRTLSLALRQRPICASATSTSCMWKTRITLTAPVRRGCNSVIRRLWQSEGHPDCLARNSGHRSMAEASGTRSVASAPTRRVNASRLGLRSRYRKGRLCFRYFSAAAQCCRPLPFWQWC